MSPCYDRRFIGAFLGELQKRNNPSYPRPEWWRALAAADLQAGNLPLRDFRAELSSIQAVSHTRRLSTDKYLMVQINQACNRWWHRHGLAVR